MSPAPAGPGALTAAGATRVYFPPAEPRAARGGFVIIIMARPAGAAGAAERGQTRSKRVGETHC